MSEAVNRRTGAKTRVVLSPDEGETVWLRKLGIRFMIGGEESEGNFALVEHPIKPRALAAPMHTHRHEDEYTYVLEGEIGVQIGEEVRVARPGDLVFKPRGVPHAFWNATDSLARPLDEEAVGAVWDKYGLKMDLGSIPVLAERYGLVVDAPPTPSDQ